MNKKIILGFFASLFFFTTIQAQQGEPQPMKTADRLAMWKDSLNLTPAQLEKIWAIEKEYNPEFDTVKFEGIFDAIRAREQTRVVKIKEVLTDKQNARLTEMEELMGGLCRRVPGAQQIYLFCLRCQKGWV